MQNNICELVRVLVVDDEEPIRQAYRQILSGQAPSPGHAARQELRARLFQGGAAAAPVARIASNRHFETVCCADAVSAVEAVRVAREEHRPFALVYLDMRMPPGPDGAWAAEQIRALDPEIEIIVCTAFSDLDPAEIARRAPPEDKLFYLQKPFHPHEVRQIAIALGSKWSAGRNIRKLAYHDSLTGLPNRARFQEMLSTALDAKREGREPLALLYLDLDNFKRVNDTLGHGVGDELLVVMAERLQAVCRRDFPAADPLAESPSGLDIARLGGDEFVLLVRQAHAADEAGSIAARVIESLCKPMKLSGHEIRVTPSIGIAMFPSDGEDVDTLCRNADLAMYFAKRQGPGRVALYKETMNASGLERLTLEASLRGALERNEFSLHYQPQVHLGSGHISGFEALLRWTSSELGSVPPSDFIPVAEEIGLMVPLGEWVLRTACQQAKAWHDQGLPAGRVAVNVSCVQLADKDFPSVVATVLRETGLPPELLELEITESLVMGDEAQAELAFKALKKIGVSLAIDDFGTGYSTFGRLRGLPIDRLKIDRSFVHAIHSNLEDRALVAAIIKMAQTIGLGVVAEGVEDFSQLLHLQDEKCDQAQGYLLSQPLTTADAAAFLARLDQVKDTGRTMRLRAIARS